MRGYPKQLSIKFDPWVQHHHSCVGPTILKNHGNLTYDPLETPNHNKRLRDCSRIRPRAIDILSIHEYSHEISMNIP